MSLTQIFPYFQDRFEDAGFTEWQEPFDTENIPSTQIDNAYHITLGSVSNDQTNHTDIAMIASVQIDCFLQGFRDTKTKVQEAIARAEDIISSCCSSKNYQDSTQIKGVIFNNFSLAPFETDDNDNIVVCSIVFDVRVFVCIK